MENIVKQLMKLGKIMKIMIIFKMERKNLLIIYLLKKKNNV